MAACGALLLAFLLMHWPTMNRLMVTCTEDPEKTQPQGANPNAANHGVFPFYPGVVLFIPFYFFL